MTRPLALLAIAPTQKGAGSMKALCPTCRRHVTCVAANLTIRAHVDTLGYELCPSSREPFYTTLLADPEAQLHTVRRSA